MKFTDERAINLLKKVRSTTLEDDILTYPESERDDRTDLDFLADEVSYIYSCHFEDGHCYKDDLEYAKEKLRETEYGKIRRLDPDTMQPMCGYWDSDIQGYKDIVNEVARLKRLGARLQRMGYFGKWWRF